MTDKNQTPNDGVLYISKNEPVAKPPPALETGALKWMRENLFSSVWNGLLTIVGFVLVVYTIVNITDWVISTGNWLAITANIRQYMVGSFTPAFMWRIYTITLFSIFVIGMAVAIWIKQIARTMLVSILLIVAVMWLTPLITKSLVNLPSFYTLAGDGTVQTGSASESPIPQIAFIAREGEELTVRFADNEAQSEEALANMAGYVSVPANTMRNAAANRLATIEEKETFESQLAENETAEVPILTQTQVDAYTTALAGLVIPEPILETYQVNSISVQVALTNAETGELVGEPVILESAEDVASFTLPQNGWYILEKVDANAVVPEETTEETTEGSEEAPAVNTQDIRNVSGSTPTAQNATAEGEAAESGSLALLEVSGIYPSRLSNVPVAGEFVQAYSRATDFFRVDPPAPRDENNNDIPVVILTSNQYRGERPFSDYIRAFVVPFFDDTKVNVTIFLIFGILGYGAVSGLTSVSDAQRAAQITTYGLFAIPILMWVFINGFNITTAVALGGVVALALQCYGIYQLGKRNGWAGWRPSGAASDGSMLVLIAVIVSYVALILMMTRVNGGGWAGIIVRFGFLPLAISGMMGSSAHIPGDEDEVAGNTVLMPLWIASLIIIVIMISGIGMQDPETAWLFSASNPDNWSGLLLTMILTVYGIIIAFPIGIGLALGRRSDLPLIKYLCTAYIELIRGSPFITVLFFMKLLIPLIRPEFAAVPNGYRAIVATIAFSAAYMAENVRGGLQSLPPGQEEAAKALGLSAWQTTTLITLPQALRAVIPALVGQFISLFKDTSLVTIIALIDLTGVVNSMAVQPEFVGTRLEGLLFISILYFVFSYVLSYVSRLLEASGSGATRRMT